MKLILIPILSLISIILVSCSEPEPEVDMHTQAREFAPKVKVTLDVTTPEILIKQMPFRAKTSRGTGEDRVFKWVFEDGSAMVAYFRPAPGNKNGLLLHRVDFE